MRTILGGEIRMIDVLVEANINTTFTYYVPALLKDQVKIGKRVLVPFGGRELEGFIMGIHNQEDLEFEPKEIIRIIDENPVLNEEMIDLGNYMSEYYFAPLIKCYQAMLPVALKAKNKPKVGKKKESYLVLNKGIDHSSVKSEKQRQIIEVLKKEIKIRKNLILDKYSLKVLLEKGIVQEEKEEVYRLREDIVSRENPILTDDQKNAITSILEDDRRITLIRGVTGSGKTEVYMALIEHALQNKKTAIMLVPEISLTTQLIEHFSSRFGNNIAILHSGLSDGEKYDEWRRIEKGEASIVIGARSAIFAPLKHIGFIIIDEEHETTYKQDHEPMYHVLDIAVKRTETHHAKIILGSATPSMESYARAKKGYYQLVELEKRINQQPLPQVTIVSMEEEMKRGNRIFSSKLIEGIEQAIARKEQVILLLNRRGYSSVLTCQECGHTFKCPNCDITLTFHKTSGMLRCHYCGYANKRHEICPKCKSTHLRSYGLGTEKVEEELKKKLEGVRVIRMDLDTTTTKGAHGKIIHAFNEGKYDVLLGTQMIAKGLNFKKVTLVGVIDADMGLNIPDFRSGERTFSLLSQVAGRSGRDELIGEVIFQTFNKDHYVLEKAKAHDYLGFYNHELSIRKKLNYPPFCFVALIKIMTKDYEKGWIESRKIGEYLRRELPNLQVLGPTIGSISKINNVNHFQCMIKYKNREDVLRALKYIWNLYQTRKDIKVEIDMNAIRL